MIGIRDLAEVIGVPVATIYDWRSRGLGPVAHRFGKHIKFAAADVQAWIASRREQPGAAPGPRRGEDPDRPAFRQAGPTARPARGAEAEGFAPRRTRPGAGSRRNGGLR
jgi:excisionase family DNA binding protein